MSQEILWSPVKHGEKWVIRHVDGTILSRERRGYRERSFVTYSKFEMAQSAADYFNRLAKEGRGE